MIEKGGAGGIVAAPVAGQIFDYYFSRGKFYNERERTKS
jgi:hypothetical protein